METKPYDVSVAVSGRFYVSVPVPVGLSEKDAAEYAFAHAESLASDADFGPLSDIDWNVDHVETEQGKYIYPSDIK